MSNTAKVATVATTRRPREFRNLCDVQRRRRQAASDINYQCPVREHSCGSGPPSPESITFRPVASNASCIFLRFEAALPGHAEQLSSCGDNPPKPVSAVHSFLLRVDSRSTGQGTPGQLAYLDVIDSPFRVLVRIDRLVPTRSRTLAAALISH